MAIASIENGRIIPDRLTKHSDAHYLSLAKAMCDIYSNGIGKTRRSLHREVQQLLMDTPDCQPRRAEAFCKLLDEVAEYDRDARGAAAKLRRSVFRLAASYHPLVDRADTLFEREEQFVKQEIASQLDEPWTSIQKRLFKDVIDFHELKAFRGFLNPELLLSRYNVAQTQVALYNATRLIVRARADFKLILRYAKLARLMHSLRKTDWGYEFEFDGPASLLQHTHRYGVAMAKFLPGLLACKDWSLHATIQLPRWRSTVALELDSQSGLSSQAASGLEFDSKIEEAFAAKWPTVPETSPWQLHRETEILHAGQSVFMPDFVFQHPDGRRVLMEIIGFWTPEYLQHKQQVLSQFQNEKIILAVARSIRHKFEASETHRLIEYKTVLSVQDVLAVLNQST
jgi:uncharacterized protein